MSFSSLRSVILGYSIFILMELDFKTKKKEIYIPLKKNLELIIKRLKELDIHVPLARISRMELAGKFNDESLDSLRKYIHGYLHVTNNYRKVYFEFIKKIKIVFDREMTKDGSFAPGLKQYDSLKNQLSDELLKTDGKVWITSYDQYLPTIREHADKRSKHPRTGKLMFESLKSLFNKELMEIKKLQLISIKKSKLFHKDLDLAIKNPQLDWQEWNRGNDSYK